MTTARRPGAANLNKEKADMGDGNCKVDRCPEAAIADDMCRRHYQRNYRNGDPLALKILPETGGIYRINGPAGRAYVGSSENMRERWKKHKSTLRRGTHHNQSLQLLWDSYGEACFTVTMLEEITDPSLLIEAEERWIAVAAADGEVFNVSVDPGSPSRGMVHTAESRAKMSESIRAAQTPERRAAQSQRTQGSGNPVSKLTEASVLEICDLLLAGGHPAEVAAQFGVTQESVYQIRSGRTWKHVVPEETVAAMRAIRQNPWASGKRTVTDAQRERFAGVGRANKGRAVSEANKAFTSERARGAGNPRAKLNDDQAARIILALASGAQVKDLAAAYGVSATTIWRIKSGESWGHLTDAPRENGNKGVPKSEEHKAALRAASPRLNAKLTADQVRDIKARLADGVPGSVLSQEFGVSPMSISDIKHGRTWSEVTT